MMELPEGNVPDVIVPEARHDPVKLAGPVIRSFPQELVLA